MGRKKGKTLLVTGKTEKQLVDEMRIMDLADKEGFKTPPVRTCYLCKRGEGEKSLCLIEGDEENISLMPIELESRAISLEGGITMKYPLCTECTILLGLEEEEIFEEDD